MTSTQIEQDLMHKRLTCVCYSTQLFSLIEAYGGITGPF